MFTVFEQEKIASTAMFLTMTCSILIRVVLGLVYLHMIHQADNMATTKSRQLKQCKLKFANCYQLNHGIPNVPVFVDKFITQIHLGPFSMEMLAHLSGQLMLLSVVCSGIGVCRRIIAGSMLGQILPFYIFCLLGLYLYFSISSVVDLKGKRRILKINLVDYLENHLASRMDVTKEDMEMLYGPDVNSRERSKRRGDKGTLEPLAARRSIKKGVDVIPVGNRGADTVRATAEQERDREPVYEQSSRERIVGEENREEFTDSYEQELEQLLREFLMS